MGYFDDVERRNLQLEEDSDTSSNLDEQEASNGLVGQARPTTGSAFDAVDLSNVTASAALLTFAKACCEEFKLPTRAKADVIKCVALPGSNYMSIRLYACMLAMRLDSNQTQVEDFLKSVTFKDTIKQQLQARLLDPKIPYYVHGCTACFVRHMRENPAAYEIPLVVQEGLINTKRFLSAVGEILSGFCGEIRRKVFASIEDKSDIASTSEKLVIEGYVLSEDHLKHFALLRQLSKDYIEAEAEAQAKKAKENAALAKSRGKGKKYKLNGALQKSLAFWTYIDSQINRFQKYPEDKRKDIMKDIMHKDQKKYPDPTGKDRWFPPASQLVTTAWQADASFAIQVMAGYTLTAAQEGQEAPLVGREATDEGEGKGEGEGEGMTDQENHPEEDNGSIHGGGDGSVPEGPTDSQDDTSIPRDDESPRTSSNQTPEGGYPSNGVRPVPNHYRAASPRNFNNPLPNNGAPSNSTPYRPGNRASPDTVGPIRSAPVPSDSRVLTLAQTSRASLFPSSSRPPTPHAPRTASKNASGGGPMTRNKTAAANVGGPRRPIVDPYNPADSETAAASVGV